MKRRSAVVSLIVTYDGHPEVDEKRAFRRSGLVAMVLECIDRRVKGEFGGSDGTRTRDLLRDRQAF